MTRHVSPTVLRQNEPKRLSIRACQCGADETRLKIGQDVIGSGIGAGRDVVRAMIVAAVDQYPPNVGFAHLAKGDLLGPLQAP